MLTSVKITPMISSPDHFIFLLLPASFPEHYSRIPCDHNHIKEKIKTVLKWKGDVSRSCQEPSGLILPSPIPWFCTTGE